MSLLTLPSELLRVVLASLEARELAQCASACTTLRVAVRDATDGVLESLGSVSKRTINLGEVCAWLGLTADEARALPHTFVDRGKMNSYYKFDAAATVAALVRAEGWPGVGARLVRVAGRKRQRVDLDDRRGAALAKRRAAFEVWLVTCAPLGEITSISAWDAPISLDETLRKFLLADTLGAPSLKAAKAAALAFEASQQARRARRSALKDALDVHGVRADSRLCAAYEAGTPVAGFDTCEVIADEMALTRWLHQHTDYPRSRDRCQDELREAARAPYLPHVPCVWPWFRSSEAMLRLQPVLNELECSKVLNELECSKGCCVNLAAKACAHGACANCCPGPCQRHP